MNNKKNDKFEFDIIAVALDASDEDTELPPDLEQRLFEVADEIRRIKSIMNTLPDTYNQPKSTCQCGHLGDGPNSEHGGLLGHGHCIWDLCLCQKFSWKEFTPEFKKFIEEMKKNDS